MKNKIVNPVFTFWIENKVANKRKYFASDLRQIFYKWLIKQDKDWILNNASDTVIMFFISDKTGLNATNEVKEFNNLSRLLKLEINKVLS